MDEIDPVLDEIIDDVDETIEDDVEETPEEPKPEPKPKKAEETPEARKARLLRQLKRVSKELGEEEPPAPLQPKTGKLDETQLDYLDLKGITDSDEIAVIQKVMANTGQNVREALKDEYVVSKLDALRAQRAVADATPGSSRRSTGGASSDLAAAIAKYEATQVLPDDFDLRTKVVNYIVDKNDSNKPSWH